MASGKAVQLTGVAARRAIAVAVGKSARSAVRRLGKGNGTAVPGQLALLVDPGALASLVAEIPRGAVLVTGSNGKGTTCRMLSNVMQAAGLHPVVNTEGSNQRSGLATTMVAHATATGHFRRDFRAAGLFEVDEGSFAEIVRHVAHPSAVVITNLFRDQLDRYFEPAYIMALLERSVRTLPPDTTLVLNADDPRIASLAADLPNRRVYFGMSDTAAGRADADPTSDFPRCPRCGGELAYDCVFYAHLGHWACAGCGLARPEPDVSATAVELVGTSASRITVATAAGSTPLTIPLPGLYNAYNALAATAAAMCWELPAEALQSLSEVTAGSYRMEHVEVDGRDVYLALAKNSSGYTEVLRAVLADRQPRRILLGLNTTPGKQPDTSWIWDVDFESLTGLVRTPVVTGNRAADLAVRLKYAGWLDAARDITVQPDPVAAFQAAFAATPAGEPLWIVSTAIVLAQIRSWLRQQGYVREIWQEHAYEQNRARQQPRRRIAQPSRPVWPEPPPPARPLQTVELPAAEAAEAAPAAASTGARPSPALSQLAPSARGTGEQAAPRPDILAIRPAGSRRRNSRLARRPAAGRPETGRPDAAAPTAPASQETRLKQTRTGQ